MFTSILLVNTNSMYDIISSFFLNWYTESCIVLAQMTVISTSEMVATNNVIFIHFGIENNTIKRARSTRILYLDACVSS